MFAAQLADLIDHLEKKRQRPFIMGVSFGGGLLIDALRDAEEAFHKQVRGLILVSPVVCSDDLIRPAGDKQGGVRLLEHNLKKILGADPAAPEDIDKLMERSRRCFAEQLDLKLRGFNADYATFREQERIAAPRVVILSADLIYDWSRSERKKTGRSVKDSAH